VAYRLNSARTPRALLASRFRSSVVLVALAGCLSTSPGHAQDGPDTVHRYDLWDLFSHDTTIINLPISLDAPVWCATAKYCFALPGFNTTRNLDLDLSDLPAEQLRVLNSCTDISGCPRRISGSYTHEAGSDYLRVTAAIPIEASSTPKTECRGIANDHSEEPQEVLAVHRFQALYHPSPPVKSYPLAVFRSVSVLNGTLRTVHRIGCRISKYF